MRCAGRIGCAGPWPRGCFSCIAAVPCVGANETGAPGLLGYPREADRTFRRLEKIGPAFRCRRFRIRNRSPGCSADEELGDEATRRRVTRLFDAPSFELGYLFTSYCWAVRLCGVRSCPHCEPFGGRVVEVASDGLRRLQSRSERWRSWR